MEDKELKVLKLDEMTNLIWIIFIALVVIISIALVLEEGAELSIFGLMIIVAITAFFLLPIICICLLYTSPSPRDKRQSRMPSSA